jgi:hypothetical protein
MSIPDPLAQALERDYQSPDWAAAVLRVLGNHIRWLEDTKHQLINENESHRAFRQMDRDQITALKDEIEQKLEGSITEQLAHDNNALIDTVRHWVSWAGQALAFKRDVLALLDPAPDAGPVDLQNVRIFVERVKAGAYDVIPLPRDPHDTSILVGQYARSTGEGLQAYPTGLGAETGRPVEDSRGAIPERVRWVESDGGCDRPARGEPGGDEYSAGDDVGGAVPVPADEAHGRGLAGLDADTPQRGRVWPDD